MKKLLLFTLTSLVSLSLLSQSCFPEGFMVTTQEQIDNFQTDNPGCTEIEGRLNIEGDDITNLNGLSVLTTIGGRLDIIWNPGLINLEGLDNVTSIGGVFQILSNHNLTSLSGLENLTFVGGDISISANSDLTNISALSNLTHIGGDLYLGIPITSLSAFENLTYIGGHIFLKELAISNLTGLDNIVSINGHLKLSENNALTNLSGLDNLTSIAGYLYIEKNDALISLTALSNLNSIGGYLRFSGNDALTSLEGLENINANSITDLLFLGNDLLSECEVESVCDYLLSPNGDIEISNNGAGCNNQTEVENACAALSIDEIGSINIVTAVPNPFTTSTTIEYELKQTEKVSLTIYDYLGKQVYQTEKNQLKGSQHLIWNVEGFADGIYYYRLKAGDVIANGKVVKVR